MTVEAYGQRYCIVGRAEEMIARIVAEAERINGMRAGEVALHFGKGKGVAVWLHDRRCDALDTGA